MQMFLSLVFSSLTQRNPLFHPFVLFQAMRSGSVWFTWLKCSIIIIYALLLQCSHCLEMFLFFFLFLVSQAFNTTISVGKKGYSFARGCIGYYFDGLLSQLLVTLHPLVLFIAM